MPPGLTSGARLFQSDVTTRTRLVRVRPSEAVMEYHVGIDVSLELSSLCVLDAAGGAGCLPARPRCDDRPRRPGGRALVAMAV